MQREYETDAVHVRVGTVKIDSSAHAGKVLRIEIDGKPVLVRKLRLVMDAEQSPTWRVIADIIPVPAPPMPAPGPTAVPQ